ncbi:MAG: putative porin [Candidatus Omnitrophica bacterium]|nr:putative porin [Candidatus Omnitrophota bacterium]
MKRNVLIVFIMLVMGLPGFVWAKTSSVDALIQKLEDKGILTSQEAEQIKGEIASSEKESQEAVYKKTAPEWINNFKIGGVVLLRDQVNKRKVPGTTNLTQNRGRFRVRLNLEDQINDKVKVGVTLATEGGSDNGTLANGRSNTVTFGGNGGTNSGTFTTPYAGINKAWVQYKPTDYLTLTGGKMANPVWEPASLLWDPDLNPEGGAIQLEKRLNDYITPFSTNAMFVLKDVKTTTTRTDPYVFVTQEGIKGNLTEKFYYQLAGLGQLVSLPSHALLDNRGLGNTISTSNAAQYSYNFNTIGGAVDFGINDPFGEAAFLPIYIPQIGVFGQYARNTDPSKNNSTWMMGGYIGNSAINGWGTWKLKSFYKVLEADAWLDALTDDDFYSGYTDTKGWRTQFDLGLAKNVWFTMTYFRTNVFKSNSTISSAFSKSSAPENLFQMDLNFKF